MSQSDQTQRVQKLFLQHAAQVKYFVLSLLPNPSEADDVVQETFLTVTAKANDFEDGTNFKAWAMTIARFKVLEHFRSRKRTVNSLSDEVIELLAAEAADEDASDDLEEEQQLQKALAKCLRRLAPRPRQLVELVYRDGMKPGEVADRVGWKPNAVYVALSRARATLRTCIERRMKVESL